MNSPLVLISLPAELIARVADDSALSKHDLMRLRLTCRLLNFWATYSLAQQHLSKIGISLTRYDLQALSICSKLEILRIEFKSPLSKVETVPLQQFPDKRNWKLTAHGNNECIRDEITKLLRDASNSGS
ncbi:hypothetical protein VTO58DRAFT_109744 [Aureobasidium pullulans]